MAIKYQLLLEGIDGVSPPPPKSICIRIDSLPLTPIQLAQEVQKLLAITMDTVMKVMLAQENAFVMLPSMGLHVSSVCQEDMVWNAKVGYLLTYS